MRTRFSAERVTVETGARLHLGFYGLCSSSGLALGGVGLAVDGVGYKVTVAPAGELSVEGCQRERAADIALEAARLYGLPGLRVTVERCIPGHVGLGSTTQLTLSIHAAAAVLSGASPLEAVRRVNRGFYSGVGVGVWLRGGLVVDTGVTGGEPFSAKPMAYAPVPGDWRLLALLPPGRRGPPEGPLERQLMEHAVSRLEGWPGRCPEAFEALLRGVLAGAALGDFDRFVEGLERLEGLTASLFVGEQEGGLFCCREAAEAAQLLRRVGARGVGQSSWGPLVYGFYPSPRRARAALQLLRRLAPRGWTVLVLAPRLRGAVLRAPRPHRRLAGAFSSTV